MADRGAGLVPAVEEYAASGGRPRSRAAFAGACLAGAGGLLGATLIGRGTESAQAGSPAEDM
ncbi:MAG TPA: hypothetical protein VH594_27985, partial [Trebonia sp.]